MSRRISPETPLLLEGVSGEIGRHRESGGKLFGQGLRGPGEALQDLAHDGRCAPEGIGDFKGTKVPGPEPGRLPDGTLSEIEKKIPVRPVHDEDQVGPLGKERTYGPGAMAGEIEAKSLGLPDKVLRGRDVLLVGEASGGDLEAP